MASLLASDRSAGDSQPSPSVGCAVHKFGGSSLGDASCFRRVAAIVAARPESRRLVVVSAMAGVTDRLVHAVHVAGTRDFAYRDVLAGVRDRHLAVITELLPPAAARRLSDGLERDLADMEDVLRVTILLHGFSRNGLELVSGFGEVWSARILAALLNEQGTTAEWLDAREVLTVARTDAGADVMWPESRRRTAAWVAARGGMPPTVVITGFVASTAEGVAATLGRNGSDFSASIFATLMDAEQIHIWTDVDGVMSADPRLVGEAITLDGLSYDEATELAYFGAKVIHPSTIVTAIERRLPIFVRNTFRPDLPGTRIDATPSSAHPVKGLSTVESIALLNVEGIGMIGVRGVAQRLFAALRDENIAVAMISQGSSGNSICFAVPEALAERARETVEHAFFAERHHGQIQRVDVVTGCSVLAVVGEGMAGRPGMAARFLSALGKAGVNVRAIAQGASERNISVVVDGADTRRALRAAHAGFYLAQQTLSIGLVGAGSVGGTLLRQLSEQSSRLKGEFDVDLRMRAVATSSRMLLRDHPIDLAQWQTALESGGQAMDLARLAEHVHAEHLPHAVLIDCTASDEVSRLYATWLEQGIHVITPNKRANTASLDYYRRLRQANRAVGAHYLYETTV
ncbi:MAG TPA: aspartate kinase, partial [Gemmatimonadaceae bacterium]|nr:aspartate kinase [Gemmatimonadaceae bacterium]